jgi:hypothetical protein
VAVNDVIVQVFTVGEAAHPPDKFRQIVQQAVFIAGRRWTGAHMDQAYAPIDLNDSRCVVRLGTGEYIDCYTATSELAAQFADIDVHAARLLAAQTREGAAMNAQHCDAHKISPEKVALQDD